jgi:hypothetical protein
MTSPLFQCPACKATLLEGIFNQPDMLPCPACGTGLQVEVFPTMFRRMAPGKAGEAVVVEGESTCFYHPGKKAVLPCQDCGRFLCALCDCELHGQHFCPACLEVGRSKGKIKSLENRRTLYDSIALGLTVLPVLAIFTIYFTFITAPMAMYVAIRHWNAPLSIVRRTRVRYILAILFATLQIAGWGIIIYFLATAKRRYG